MVFGSVVVVLASVVFVVVYRRIFLRVFVWFGNGDGVVVVVKRKGRYT